MVDEIGSGAGNGASPPLGTGTAAGAAPRFPRLNTPGHVQAETARIYRLARSGRLSWGDACRASVILQGLFRMMQAAELAELAARIEALEAAAG